MKRKLSALAALLVLSGTALSTPADACGDKYMMPGRGLSFDEVYRARYPGSVLIYWPAGAKLGDTGKMQAMLTRAGHKVTVVRDAGQVATTVSAIKADVVVAPLADAGNVDAQAKSSPTAPAILPVLSTGNKVEKNTCKQQPYDCDLKANDGPEKFTVAVNQTMTQRAKAKPATRTPSR